MGSPTVPALAWLAVTLLLVLAGPAGAATVGTSVEIANAPPVIEAHRSAVDHQEGHLVTWVWVSDPNGLEDVSTVSIGVEGTRLSSTGTPSWIGQGVARFELHLPLGEGPPAGATITVEDSQGGTAWAPLTPGQALSSNSLAIPSKDAAHTVPSPMAEVVGILAGTGLLAAGRRARVGPGA